MGNYRRNAAEGAKIAKNGTSGRLVDLRCILGKLGGKTMVKPVGPLSDGVIGDITPHGR